MQVGGLVGPGRALGQRHLEQVAAGMRGEPGLQFRVHAVDQRAPVAAMHGAAFLGRDGLAHHLGRRLAREAQVEGRILGQAGEVHLEAAGAVQRGGAQQVEQRESASPRPSGLPASGRAGGRVALRAGCAPAARLPARRRARGARRCPSVRPPPGDRRRGRARIRAHGAAALRGRTVSPIARAASGRRGATPRRGCPPGARRR
jgi:hypothetical protein